MRTVKYCNQHCHSIITDMLPKDFLKQKPTTGLEQNTQPRKMCILYFLCGLEKPTVPWGQQQEGSLSFFSNAPSLETDLEECRKGEAPFQPKGFSFPPRKFLPLLLWCFVFVWGKNTLGIIESIISYTLSLRQIPIYIAWLLEVLQFRISTWNICR